MTVVVRANGSFLYWKPDLEYCEVKQLKKSLPQSANTKADRWQKAIQKVVKAKMLPCTIRMVLDISTDNDYLKTESMTIRRSGVEHADS